MSHRVCEEQSHIPLSKCDCGGVGSGRGAPVEDREVGVLHRAPAASNPLLPHERPLPPGQPTPDSAQVSSQGTGNDVTSPGHTVSCPSE